MTIVKLEQFSYFNTISTREDFDNVSLNHQFEFQSFNSPIAIFMNLSLVSISDKRLDIRRITNYVITCILV